MNPIIGHFFYLCPMCFSLHRTLYSSSIWICCLLCLMASSLVIVGGSTDAGPATQISLLTASPGEELYSSFGHSAIRIRDTIAGIDRVFNYGTFDFDTPNFYGKFIRGNLNYRLSVASFDSFLENYRYEERAVYEQSLALNQAECQAVMDFLVENYKPQNRYYRYDFFFDNCATRIRDLFELVLNNRLKWHFEDSSRRFSPDTPPSTFRQLVDQCTRHRYWADFGIDLMLGAKTDRLAQPREYLFLPDYLQKAFGKATLTDSTGIDRPLVAQTRQLLYAQLLHPAPFWQGPTVVFSTCAVLVMLLSIWARRKKRELTNFDRLLFGSTGFLGWFLLFCWFGTSHSVLVNNWNLVWAFPLHLPVALLALRQQPRFNVWRKWYFGLSVIVLLTASFSWVLFPQIYHPAVSSLIFILLFRSIVNWETAVKKKRQLHRPSVSI